MALNSVSDITVERIIKKKTPSKAYVFSIQVEWKNDMVIPIYRSYTDIRGLQQNLLKQDAFLTYLKNEYAEHRTGYLLSEKNIFGKLGIKTKKKIMIRLQEVDEFLKSVIHLPNGISKSETVLQFFRPVPDDMMLYDANDYSEYGVQESKGSRRSRGYSPSISEPILLDQYVATCDYTNKQANCLSLKAGNIVEVIIKGEHGWWFVDLDGDYGWVPASLLTPRDGEDDLNDHIIERFEEDQGEMCFAMDSYEPADEDEITLEVGKILQVKQKNIDGWWLVSCDDRTGWVPCMYLRSLSSTRGNTRQMERETAMENIQNILAITERRRTWQPSLRPINPMVLSQKRCRGSTLIDSHQPYMNIDYSKKNNNNSNNNASDTDDYEEVPSYINVDYGKNVKKNAGKRHQGNNVSTAEGDYATPSYINVNYKNNTKKKAGKRIHGNRGIPHGPPYMNTKSQQKDDQRTRRRKDDEDFAEIDFGKLQTAEKKEAKEVIVNINEENAENPEQSKDPAQENQVERQSKQKHNLPNLNLENISNIANIDDSSHVEGNKEMARNDSHENPIEVFLSIGDYTKDADTEVNLQEGQSVEVLEQTDGGWWLVRTRDLSIGWAPSNFLQKIKPEEFERRKAMGLEPPERSPLRPPKSPNVHRKALHICSERNFWSFVNNNGKNAKHSIVEGEDKKAGDADDVNLNESGQDALVCNPDTENCKLDNLSLSTKL